MPSDPHPMQPIAMDAHGVVRFKSNAMVKFLVDFSREKGIGLNEMAFMPFSDEDRIQLAQLIGYSVSGFNDLSFVDDATANRASDEVRRVMSNQYL